MRRSERGVKRSGSGSIDRSASRSFARSTATLNHAATRVTGSASAARVRSEHESVEIRASAHSGERRELVAEQRRQIDRPLASRRLAATHDHSRAAPHATADRGTRRSAARRARASRSALRGTRLPTARCQARPPPRATLRCGRLDPGRCAASSNSGSRAGPGRTSRRSVAEACASRRSSSSAKRSVSTPASFKAESSTCQPAAHCCSLAQTNGVRGSTPALESSPIRFAEIAAAGLRCANDDRVVPAVLRDQTQPADRLPVGADAPPELAERIDLEHVHDGKVVHALDRWARGQCAPHRPSRYALLGCDLIRGLVALGRRADPCSSGVSLSR